MADNGITQADLVAWREIHPRTLSELTRATATLAAGHRHADEIASLAAVIAPRLYVRSVAMGCDDPVKTAAGIAVSYAGRTIAREKARERGLIVWAGDQTDLLDYLGSESDATVDIAVTRTTRPDATTLTRPVDVLGDVLARLPEEDQQILTDTLAAMRDHEPTRTLPALDGVPSEVIPGCDTCKIGTRPDRARRTPRVTPVGILAHVDGCDHAETRRIATRVRRAMRAASTHTDALEALVSTDPSTRTSAARASKPDDMTGPVAETVTVTRDGITATRPITTAERDAYDAPREQLATHAGEGHDRIDTSRASSLEGRSGKRPAPRRRPTSSGATGPTLPIRLTR